jgi:hypothetical protein
MNLVFCNDCGVMFNGNVVKFPPPYDLGNELYTIDNYEWNGESYIPIAVCPVCGGKVSKE